MNPEPTCMTCVHWHVIDRCNGWCNRFAKYKYDSGTCEKHVSIKIEPIDKLKNTPQPVDKEEWFI
jgi:hypothetical protein